MNYLAKFILTVIAGSALLLSVTQAAEADPGDKNSGNPQTRVEKKEDQRQPSSTPARAETGHQQKENQREQPFTPIKSQTDQKPKQKQKENQRQPPSYPARGEVDKKTPDGPVQTRPTGSGSTNRSSDFNKWDKGRADQNHNDRSQPGRPGGQATTPKSSGLTRDQAWNMAREHKLTGYKALPDHDHQELVKGRPLPSRLGPKPVPEPMRKRLPAHSGHEWRIVGRDLVLVAAGTLIITEIIQNVFD